jgi:hypothetical protein
MTDAPLPQRRTSGVPYLPPLVHKVYDNPDWTFRPPQAPAPGTARLRVWDTADGGFFAVVTECGDGLSVTNGAQHIWQTLTRQYGQPFGLLELWPEGESGDLHADLVLESPQGGLSWSRVHPVHPSHPDAGMFDVWWDVYGGDILHD